MAKNMAKDKRSTFQKVKEYGGGVPYKDGNGSFKRTYAGT